MRLVGQYVGGGVVAVFDAVHHLFEKIVLCLYRHIIVFQHVDAFAQRNHCLPVVPLRLCLCELCFQCFDAIVYLLPALLELGKVINACFVGIACTLPGKFLLLERCFERVAMNH